MNISDQFKGSQTVDPKTGNIPAGNEKTGMSVSSTVNEKVSDKNDSTSGSQSEVTTDGKRRVHNLIILDESGSMQAIYQPALTGVNETLQSIREAQKEHKDQEHFVSLIAFDSSRYNEIYKNTPAERTVDITTEQYRPWASTPLFDAMGRSITELQGHLSKGDVVLVTIITDGYENASREYDRRAIRSLVEAMKSQGWVFTYIGANQDVEAVADSMSIDNHMIFFNSAAGVNEMFDKEIRCRKRFFDRINQQSETSNLSTGYFDEDEKEDK